MKKDYSVGLLILGIISLIIAFCLPRIPQSTSYHQFADVRTIFGIKNFWNAVSNIPFFITALYGLLVAAPKPRSFQKRLNTILFISIGLTGIGSTIYHLWPSNQTLVFDRLPLILLLTTYFLLVIYTFLGENITKRIGYPFFAGAFCSVGWGIIRN